MIIENLEIAYLDFIVSMKWNEAVLACTFLGGGWRLPTKDELNILNINYHKIYGLKRKDYWSSTQDIKYRAWSQNFQTGHQYNSDIAWELSVRAVRDITKSNILLLKPILPGKTVKSGNLEIAQYDFPYRMHFGAARVLCEGLGDGWRLPTKEELSFLCKNKDKIGGFESQMYWSSTIRWDYGYSWIHNFYLDKEETNNHEAKMSVRAVRTL